MTKHKYIALAILAVLVLGSMAAEAQQKSAPVVAYVYNDGLWLWQGEKAERIAEGNIYQVTLSPSGQRIAYARDNALWLAEGQNPRLLIELDAPHHVYQLTWRDADTLYFNTRFVREGEMVGVEYANDLWRVDIGKNGDEVAQLLAPGAGGRFTISPDGEHIALVTPGVYGDENKPGKIHIIDPDGKNRAKVFSYPAVSTGSQYAFYPTPHWQPGSDALRVAVPDPDAVYALGETPLVVLWEIDDGSAEPIDEVPADYFSVLHNPAFWSPDGSRIAYMKRVGRLYENQMALCTAAVGTDAVTCSDEGYIGGFVPMTWSRSGDFIYREDVEYGAIMWQVVPGEEPQRFPGEPAYRAMVWVDEETYVYSTTEISPVPETGQSSSTYLKFKRLGEDAQTIAEFEDGAWPEFSAVMVP